MQQLLEAALLPQPQAIASWQSYLSQNDLQTVDHTAISLLPLVYRNLKEESHPLCKSAYRHTWAANQVLWLKTLPTLQKLLGAGVEKIVLLKGMAMILHHYRDFGVRTLGDIDILIDRKHLPLAHQLLLSWGWECKLPRFNPRSAHQLSRWNGANFTHPSGMNLDLHWQILLESNPALDEVVLQAVPPGIHPATPTHLFLQTCIHGYKKSTAPLIRWIPDAIALLKSPIDFPHLFDLAQKAHLTLPFAAALDHLRSHFNASIPPFEPKLSLLERLELKANLRGQIYWAAYFRARMRGKSLLHYLQHTANLPSPWLVPLYAPWFLLKRLFRLLKLSCLFLTLSSFSGSVFFIGDSHTLTFANTENHPEIQKYWLIRPFVEGRPGHPHTMYIIGRDHGEGIVKHEEFARVQEGDALVFSFGFIDVNHLIWKQLHIKQRSLEEVVETLVDNYLDAVVSVTDKNVTKIVYCISPPSNWGSDLSTYRGTIEERVLYSRKLNEALAKGCTARNLEFLDAYEEYSYEDGSLRMYLTDGVHHVRPDCNTLLLQKIMAILQKQGAENSPTPQI